MDIGRVLLRDAQYVWRERSAVLEKDAVVLQPRQSAWQAAVAAVGQPKRKQKQKPRLKTKASKLRAKPKTVLPAEVLPLDGSLSCEAVVVSSAHMHSVKLQDLRSGREFLVDVTTKGKRQMWVDLFSSARGRVNITGSWRRKMQSISAEDGGRIETAAAGIRALTLLDLQQAVEMLIAETTESDMVVLCGCDVESILLGDGSAADFTEIQAVEIAQRLVEENVLIPFCCSCSFVYGPDRVYRVNMDHVLVKEAKGMDVDRSIETEVAVRQQGRRRCRGHLLWLHDRAFKRLLTRFEQDRYGDEGLSGTEGIQALLQFGAHSVPTAIALGNELLHHELIMECFDSSDDDTGIAFQLDSTARYKKVVFETANDGVVVDDGNDERHMLVSNERAARSHEVRLRLETQIQNQKAKYHRLFNLFCFCCVLVLFDAFVANALFPGPLKFSLVTGLLLWLTLSGGTATLSINLHGHKGKMTGFSRGDRDAGVKANFQQPYLLKRASSIEDDDHNEIGGAMTTGDSTFRRDSAMNLMNQDRATIVLTRAEEAEVHSFRQAIAQAANVPVEETIAFSDEYLFSVLRVKNRSFSYAVTKMAHIVEWRRNYDVEAIKWDDVKSQLVSGNMYWYGYDFQNRPILWVRAKLKDWSTMSNRRDVEVRAHVYLLELGCRQFMPPGCTTYTIVTDSAGLGMAQVDIRLMRGLLDVCVANFPDRIGLVHAGPLTRFLKHVTSWLWPFLPVRLRGKVSLMHDCAAELSKYMKSELIPLHMGGAATHNLCADSKSPTAANDALDITYMIDQQKRIMEELKI